MRRPGATVTANRRGTCSVETRSRCVTAWARARRTSRGVSSQPAPQDGGAEPANRRRAAVEPRRPVADRGIAAPADILNDARGLPFHIRTACFVTRGERANSFTMDGADDAHQSTILLSGYSTIPDALACLRRGISSRTVCSSMIVFTATQPSSLKRRDGRPLERRQQAEHRRKILALDVQHQADAALRFDRRFQQQCDVVEFRPLPVVGERRRVRDELRVRLEHGVDDPQPIRAQRRSRLGDLDDRVGEDRRLHLGRSPRKLHVDIDAERA